MWAVRASFKLTYATYGYTVIGKGTTNGWWSKVSRETDAYKVLWNAEASAVTVFLGKISMSKVNFLEGAGEIQQMLILGWGGKTPQDIDVTFLRELDRRRKSTISASNTKIYVRATYSGTKGCSVC